MKCNDCLKTISKNYYNGKMKLTKCASCQNQFSKHDSCVHHDI